MSRRAGLSLGVATVVLAGCGGSGSPVEVATTPSSAASRGPATPSGQPVGTATPAATASSAAGRGASFGVDRRRWPTTVGAARTVLNRLPKRLNGRRLQLATDPRDKRNAAALYDPMPHLSVSGEYVTTDTADGKPELMSAVDLMSAGFGIAYACAKGSYRGTAPKFGDFDGPASSKKPIKKDVWFSCAIDGAEGEEDFTGHAVGWTSGKIAWVLIAQDRAAAASLVQALDRAAG